MHDQPEARRLRAVLQARLTQFRETAHPDLLLDREATTTITGLRAAIGWPAAEVPPSDAVLDGELASIATLAAVHHRRRALVAPVEALDEDLALLELSVAVHRLAPEMVVDDPGIRRDCARLSVEGGLDPAVENDAALELLERAAVTQVVSDIDHAVRRLGLAVLAATQRPDVSNFLCSLGVAWQDRFAVTRRVDDLRSALRAYRSAVRRPIADPVHAAGHLTTLATAELAWFETTGDRVALSDAVGHARQAVRVIRGAAPAGPGGGGDHARSVLTLCLHNACGVLTSSYLQTGDVDALNEAIAAGQESAALTSPDEPALSSRWANTANGLLARFERDADVADLDEATTCARRAVEAAATDQALCTLAGAYLDHYELAGRPADLAEATRLLREAATSAAPTELPGVLANLGTLLRQRYEHDGDSAALSEAIDCHRRALALAQDRHPDRPLWWNGLGTALRLCYEADHDAGDLAASADALTQAAAAVDAAHPGRSTFLINLGDTLTLEFRRTNDVTTLERAIDAQQTAIGLLPEAHPRRPGYLANLGTTLRTAFDELGDPGRLDQAVTVFEEAVRVASETSPHRPRCLAGLGSVLHRRFQRTADRDTGQAAVAACREAAEIPTAAPLLRALAARRWGDIAAALQDAEAAADGFGTATALLARVAWVGLPRRDQERSLVRLAAVPNHAAAWALSAGRSNRAVEILEQGRGIMLGHVLNTRLRDDLRRAAPGLAAELDAAESALARGDAALERLDGTAAGLHDRLLALVQRRDAVIEEIRTIPGFADFWRAPTFDHLSLAAGQGPVVLVNVSRHRCDALTVLPYEVRVTRLAITGQDVLDQVRAVTAAVETTGPATRPAMIAALDWLWTTIAEPVLAGLPERPPGSTRRRLWWCPTGPLAFLPLHAAQNATDAVHRHAICSYTPTLRLLLEARHREATTAGHAAADTAALLVAASAVAGQEPLEGAEREADQFIKTFPEAGVLRGATATVRAVTAALTRPLDVAHLACHGDQDLDDPSAGHLLLRDGELSVATLMSLRLEGVRLVYLSACHTYRGGGDLANEHLTLATAVRVAGCAHAIGTLWQVNDRRAETVAADVYTTITSAPGTVAFSDLAAALDSAVSRIRALAPSEPRQWASFIHIGP